MAATSENATSLMRRPGSDASFETAGARLRGECCDGDETGDQRERDTPHRFTQIRITPHRLVNSAGAPFVVGYASIPAMSDGGIRLISWNCM